MRKIEQKIVDAIQSAKPLKSGNDRVEIEHNIASVYLHGNEIAEYIYSQRILTVKDGNYQSNTTKSRLNAVMRGLGLSYGVVQRDKVWYVINMDGKLLAFDGSARFKVKDDLFLGK